jgi:plasmid stability protein
MPSQNLSVAIPTRVLTQIRKRARQAKRSVEEEVVSLLTDALSANGAATNGKPAPTVKKKPRTSLTDWAEENSEDWGDRIRSDDVESFTGRRY